MYSYPHSTSRSNMLKYQWFEVFRKMNPAFAIFLKFCYIVLKNLTNTRLPILSAKVHSSQIDFPLVVVVVLICLVNFKVLSCRMSNQQSGATVNISKDKKCRRQKMFTRSTSLPRFPKSYRWVERVA